MPQPKMRRGFGMHGIAIYHLVCRHGMPCLGRNCMSQTSVEHAMGQVVGVTEEVLAFDVRPLTVFIWWDSYRHRLE